MRKTAMLPFYRFRSSPTAPHAQKSAKIMKIAGIVIFLLSTFVVKSNAQYYNESYNSLVGGLVGGINFSQVDGDGYRGYHNIGFTGGGVVYLPFGDMDLPIEGTLALSMEVLFTQKGSKGRDPIPNTNILSQNIKLQYAEVPLQLNFYRGSRKSGFGAGLAIGYLATSEETIDNGSGTIIKNGLPFKKFDLNFVLTGNLHLYKGFFLSPRFQYSLLSVRNNNGKYGGRNEQFNNVVSIRLMYLIKRRGEEG
jgi:hypothetical protein